MEYGGAKKGRVYSMYKKFVMQLLLFNMMVLSGWFCLKGVQANKLASMPAFNVDTAAERPGARMDRFSGMPKRAASGQRVVDYTVMEKEYKYDLSQADYEALLKIVQAEAGSEDEAGRMLVAGVVMNRVNSSRFPDTVTEVVMQKENGVYQFSPVGNGSYQKVKVTQATINAVERVLKGEDITQGALYFAARKSADPGKMRWFDNALVKL